MNKRQIDGGSNDAYNNRSLAFCAHLVARTNIEILCNFAIHRLQ